MKKVYLIVLLNILFFSAIAQNFQWANRAGKWAYDYGYGIKTDVNGNVYVAGKYEENGAFFNTSTVTCAGNHDIFLAKYDASGNLGWVRTGGGANGDYAQALDCDGTNYVYIAGEIEGYGNTVGFSNSSATIATKGDNDIFFAKYDLDGNLLWVKSEGGLNSEKALSITYDNSGNVFIAGYFSSTTTIGAQQITGAGGRDIYVAKFDANGVFQWVKHAGSAGRDEVKGMKCDAAGNVYVCGMHSNNCNFGSITLNSPNGYFNAFVAKYSPNGDLLWAKTAGGDYDDVAWSLVLDNQENIYTTGEFNAYALFGSHALTTTGQANVFVAAYDTNGNELWAKGAGGSLNDRARGIGSNGNDLFITGQFGGTAAFGNHNISAADSSDVFIVALNNAGNFLWAAAVGGAVDAYEPLGYESGIAITGTTGGDVYATGGLLDGGIFGATNLNAFARTDVFVAKISSMPASVSEKELVSDFYIYPNPANGVFNFRSSVEMNRFDMTIYNSLGQEVHKKSYAGIATVKVDLSSQPDGVYISEMKYDNTLIRKKIIVKH
jgi:hypothetical protein